MLKPWGYGLNTFNLVYIENVPTKQPSNVLSYSSWAQYEKLSKKGIKDRGFCVKGIKHQTCCYGDSGSPAIWYDKSGEPYLIGISYLGQSKCGRKRCWSGKKIYKWEIPELQKSYSECNSNKTSNYKNLTHILLHLWYL